jgi:hypothetical protein
MRIHLKDDGKDYYPLMIGRPYLAVIKRCIQSKYHIHLVCKSVKGYWFIVKNESEAGMSKRMENFIKKERHIIERIEYYSKHPEAIRQCKHGHMMDITHRTSLTVDEYFCHCLLCGCEGGHSKDIDEAVRIWNKSRLDGGEGDRV